MLTPGSTPAGYLETPIALFNGTTTSFVDSSLDFAFVLSGIDSFSIFDPPKFPDPRPSNFDVGGKDKNKAVNDCP